MGDQNEEFNKINKNIDSALKYFVRYIDSVEDKDTKNALKQVNVAIDYLVLYCQNLQKALESKK